MGYRMIFVIFFIRGISTLLNLRENDSCLTPNGFPGRCIKITLCPKMMLLLKNRRTQNDTKYIKDSHCGFIDKLPLVCCDGIEDRKDRIVFPGNKNNFENLSPKQNDLSRSGLVLPSDCGQDLSNRIMGGSVADIQEFPWLALLEYNTPNGIKTACGGALIHKRYVLTAAHCLVGKDLPTSWKLQNVRLGEWNTSSNPDCVSTTGSMECANEPVTVPVETQFINEGFQPCVTYFCLSKNQKNDIALLRLSRDVPFSSFVKPICLPKSDTLMSKGWVAGWGKTETSSNSEVKLKVELPIVQNEICQKRYDDYGVNLVETQICAGGEPGEDSCRGDSGGPLMQLFPDDQGNPRWVAVGLVSFGPSPCGDPDHPGVYTSVQSFMPWILSKMQYSILFPEARWLQRGG